MQGTNVSVDINTIRLDAWTWTFRMGLDDVRAAYEGARKASLERRKSLEKSWEEFKAEVDAGKATMEEVDEDGQVFFDHGDQMGELMQEVDSALKLIREAFLISLAHFWERDVNRRMGVKRYVPKEAYPFLEGRGLKPDRPKLDALWLASNVAKHSAGPSSESLLSIRPDLFDLTHVGTNRPASYEDLRISDAVIEEFFDAVRSSGPQGRR